ncbi:MAG: Rpn family recombination-promoting nuclease/putative transposase, partial [bacterium]|nr:Rpn family recombination-promoting nuclease/putative transposase [bacterium]
MTASGFTFDKSLKDVLANPVCIRQLLQLYVCRAEVLEEIDFERIEQLGTEFIDSSTQRSYYGDMLWKIGYKDPKREPLYLVLLLELQSTNCCYMALRMNNYMTQFYLRLLKTPAAQEIRLLPQVLPVVFYTGWNVWKGPLSVCELIENGGAGIWNPKPLYNFQYLLLDVPRLINKAEKNSPLWLLVDSLQINEVDKFWERWHNLKRVLPELGNQLYQ